MMRRAPLLVPQWLLQVVLIETLLQRGFDSMMGVKLVLNLYFFSVAFQHQKGRKKPFQQELK